MRIAGPTIHGRLSARWLRAMLSATLLGGVLTAVGTTTGPVAPAVADVPAESLSLGGVHTCAVVTGGQVRCWGSNALGQLGTGSTTTSFVPVTVTGSDLAPLTGVVQISAGAGHTCARLATGQVRCWGDNADGQLGDGTVVQRNRAVTVTNPDGTPLSGVTEVDAGANHTCARRSDGSARCWGRNVFGQLGTGDTLERRRATAVSSGAAALTGVLEISAGFAHTCARTGTNLRCWGANGNGQVGDGTTTQRNTPVFVRNTDGTPLAGVAEVVTGAGQHTCARTTDRTARCWGANSVGQVGDGTTATRLRPVFVRNSDGTPFGSIDHLAAGDGTTCARGTDSTARCWGTNNRGQVGDASTTTRLRPVFVRDAGGAPLGGVTQIATANEHSCARLADRTVRCWGEAGDGQTGDNFGDLRRPVPVGVLEPAAPFVGAGSVGSLTAGSASTCAITPGAGLQCWGDGGAGQTGNGAPQSGRPPTRVVALSTLVPLSGVVQVDSGINHHCARLADTTVRCWGLNLDGELGDGTTVNRFAAVTVGNADGSPLTAVTGIGLGDIHSCAVQADTRVRCWGYNSAGQLGDGSTTNRLRPVFVRNADGTPLSGVAQVAAGLLHTCARMTDSTVRCWGASTTGQLGDGTSTSRPSPVFVRNADGTPLSGVAQVAAGFLHTCARMTDGTARCWGFNNGGQVGDGSTVDRSRPVFVRSTGTTPLGGIAQIDAGTAHTCARMTDGTARCWGANSSSQIGDGTTTNRLNPAFVRSTDGTPLSGIAQLGSGQGNNCVRLTTGTTKCWGSNGLAQLGDGTATARTRPVTVLGGPFGGVA